MRAGIYGSAFLIFLLIVGCVSTEWVKEGVSEGDVRMALRECQSLVIRPLPDPSRKVSPPPDTSSLQVDRCMKDKGFTRVQKGEEPQKEPILSVPNLSSSPAP